MRTTGRQARWVPALALVLALALTGCGATALITAQGPVVETAALPDGLAADTAANAAADAVGPADDDADAAADAAQDAAETTQAAAADAAAAAPAAEAQPEEDAALTVAPGLLTQEPGSAAQAMAIWSGLQQLRQKVLDHPVHLAVPDILQKPELPNGCEITSATIALNYLGVPADKIVMARDYLPKSEDFRNSDPEKEFMGSPFAGELGTYCMPPPVVKAVNDYLADVGRTDLQARDVSGADLDELKAYLHEGTPVLVWVTMYFQEPRPDLRYILPDGSDPYVNLHCVVLTGYDDSNFYLTDPLAQSTSQDYETFSSIYEVMGRRAVVIAPR